MAPPLKTKVKPAYEYENLTESDNSSWVAKLVQNTPMLLGCSHTVFLEISGILWSLKLYSPVD
jgi:hypothetical protein